uniref:Uncharacterized protein n=1 Tax=Podoviridae sp. ctV3c15 TaxID=2826559 RepID=A0A8S5MRR5_9CAUD|nr:MAG TPA: hypothetical protein [Podoviridae sp. ctV3c15]
MLDRSQYICYNFYRRCSCYIISNCSISYRAIRR